MCERERRVSTTEGRLKTGQEAHKRKGYEEKEGGEKEGKREV